MYPVYGYMEPYPQTSPHQRQPNTYPFQYFPSWEAMPRQTPQMKAGLFKHPPPCAPSSFNGSNCYPNPADHGGCCHQTYPLGYYGFRPPYPHLHAPPQMYYYGPCPYPDAYTSYFVPPSHYSVDQARYDYDKNKYHCCSCPNHPCHQRDKSSPIIEEQKPEKEDKDHSSLIQSDCPYPVVWIPPGYMKAKENEKASELQPGQGIGWIPFDLNSLKGLRQDGDDQRRQRQSPFPVVWMPGYGKPEEAVKELGEPNTTPKTVEEWPSKLKFVPLEFLENENRGEKPAVVEEHKNEDKPEAAVEKASRTKIIPVKHLEEKNDKKNGTTDKQEEKFDERMSMICGRQKKESEVKKASDNTESSPVRSSKLPPVCLRVDPLPKRKSVNGKSRSPSPPGLKEEKGYQHKEEQRPMKDTSEEGSRRKEIPVIAVKDILSSDTGKEHKSQDEVPVASLKDSSEKADMGKADKVEDSNGKEASHKVVEVLEGGRGQEKKDEGGNSVEGQGRKVEKMEGKKGKVRNLSESDAAVIIQSAYRGFEVRKWQSLEKLRKIARIREQASSIRMQIQNFEGASREQQLKQKVVIGETIMNLLLQLDTIQGLHPSFREVRKSVARELTCLQEKLDMLCSQITEEDKPIDGEKKTSDETPKDRTACVISACPEANLSCNQELSEEKGESMGGTTTKEPEIVEDSLTDAPPDEKVAVIASPAEHATEQEPVQLANENSSLEQPSFENEGSDGGSANIVADIACPSFVEDATTPSLETEPVSEQPTDRNNVAEQQVMENQESVAALESYEDRAAAGQTEDKFMVEDLNELSSDSEISEVSELTSKNQCEQESSVSSDEKQLTCGDTVRSPHAEEVEESLDEVKKHEEAEEKEACPEVEDELSLESEVSELTSKSQCEHGLFNAPVSSGEKELTSGDTVPSLEFEESLQEDRKHDETGETEAHPGAGEDTDANKEIQKFFQDNSQSEVRVSMEEQHEGVDGVQEEFQGLPYMGLCRRTDAPMENDDVKEVITENSEMSPMGNTIHLNEENKSNAGAIEEVAGSNELAALGTEGVYMNQVHSSLGSNDEAASPELLRATAEEVELEAPKDERSMTSREEGKLVEENKKLREMLEKLLAAGKEQLGVISNLNGRVKDLERKLGQKKVKVRRQRPAKLRA